MKIKTILWHIESILRKAYRAGMDSDEYVQYLRNKGVRIGRGVLFRDPLHTRIDITRSCLVEIGNNLDINTNFAIMTHDFGTYVFRNVYNDFVNSSGKVTIGNNIVFGRDVTVLKGVAIGDNCIIGAGSIVSKSIPPNSVAIGSPARVVCTLNDYYKKRKEHQVREALEYGRELAKVRGGVDNLKISDFPEEWVLFLSENEYKKNSAIRHEVDFRLKGRVDIFEFLNRPRPFSNFSDFLKAIETVEKMEVESET